LEKRQVVQYQFKHFEASFSHGATNERQEPLERVRERLCESVGQ
jgi:hypothetical protein